MLSSDWIEEPALLRLSRSCQPITGWVTGGWPVNTEPPTHIHTHRKHSVCVMWCSDGQTSINRVLTVCLCLKASHWLKQQWKCLFVPLKESASIFTSQSLKWWMLILLTPSFGWICVYISNFNKQSWKKGLHFHIITLTLCFQMDKFVCSFFFWLSVGSGQMRQNHIRNWFSANLIKE